MNREDIGQALGRVPSGLFIVTAKHQDREDAVLASWVAQCSFEPPMVSIVFATARPARLLVEASRSFIINILGKDDNTLLKKYSKPPKDATSLFEGVETRSGRLGIRILSDAVAYLECELAQQVSVGDHIVYFGKVVGGGMLKKGGEPYIHLRQNGFNY